MEKDISYVARHYKKGKFSNDKGWKRLGIAPAARLRRLRVAAVIASAIVLSAAAAIVYNQLTLADTPVVAQPVPQTEPAKEVKAIDFEDTPLPTVISKIREIYGVDITGIPENAADQHLSLHYEGSATGLIETINEILDTNMAVKE